jgi:hypothetical protein
MRYNFYGMLEYKTQSNRKKFNRNTNRNTNRNINRNIKRSSFSGKR